MRILLFCISVFTFLPGLAQNNIQFRIDQSIITDSLPPNLRNGKTMVILEVEGENQKEWDRVSKIAHQEMTKAGIDAVMYYSHDILFSGYEITAGFIKDFTSREIKNIVLIYYSEKGSQIAAMSFNVNFFWDIPQKAWKRSGEFGRIINQLYVLTANSGQKIGNLLLLEVPEKGPETSAIIGKRAEFFSLAMSTSKMAVPKFDIAIKDQELHAIIQASLDTEFQLVGPNMSDDEIRDLGYQFVLRSVRGPQSQIRSMLDYSDEEGTKQYITTRMNNASSEPIALVKDAVVYKFYIKHILSNTTYLGTEWDADLTWEQALQNHLLSLKKRVAR